MGFFGLLYCRSMQRSDWDRLTAPFSMQSLAWRIHQLAPDGRSARVLPLLRAEAIAGRLDEVAGPGGWSLRYRPFEPAVGCELTVDGVTRSAIVEPVLKGEGPEACSHAALARAAELFGLRAPAEGGDGVWVDYDPDEGVAMAPDEALAGTGPDEAVGDASAAPEAALASPGGGAGESERSGLVKPEGQQAIDRLVERLRAEGNGLETARLLVRYGGYGSDPQAARELYGKLRELLARRAETST
jgi:hypothetical protein